MHTPASEHPHVTEGVCVCHIYTHPSGAQSRIPSARCGLSAHRVAALAAASALRTAGRGD